MKNEIDIVFSIIKQILKNAQNSKKFVCIIKTKLCNIIKIMKKPPLRICEI